MLMKNLFDQTAEFMQKATPAEENKRDLVGCAAKG
jgi:hypothetical protein